MEIRHVGISVTDEKKALFFYRDLLGFKVIEKTTEEPNYIKQVLKITNLVTIKLKDENDNILELYLMPRDKEKGRWNHIALTVTNLKDLYLKLITENIKFVSEPKTNPDKTVNICFCKDYDSNLLELVEQIAKPELVKISKRKAKISEKVIKKISKRGLADIKKTRATITEAEFKRGDSEVEIEQS